MGSATIGTLVHAVIRDLGDADADALTAEIDRRWPQLGLPPGWVAERQREEAHRMAVRVASYFQQARAQQWELVGAEAPLRVTVGRAVLTGSVDRLERHTEHGLVRVIDYKTGASKPKADAVATVPQLGAYQVRCCDWVGGPDRLWPKLPDHPHALMDSTDFPAYPTVRACHGADIAAGNGKMACGIECKGSSHDGTFGNVGHEIIAGALIGAWMSAEYHGFPAEFW